MKATQRAHRVENRENETVPDVAALIRPNWSRSVNLCLALKQPFVLLLLYWASSSPCDTQFPPLAQIIAKYLQRSAQTLFNVCRWKIKDKGLQHRRKYDLIVKYIQGPHCWC